MSLYLTSKCREQQPRSLSHWMARLLPLDGGAPFTGWRGSSHRDGPGLLTAREGWVRGSTAVSQKHCHCWRGLASGILALSLHQAGGSLFPWRKRHGNTFLCTECLVGVVSPFPALLSTTLLNPALPSPAQPCLVQSCPDLPYPIVSYPALLTPAQSFPAQLCSTLPSPAQPYPDCSAHPRLALPCPALFCPALPHPALPYPALPCPGHQAYYQDLSEVSTLQPGSLVS